MTLAIASCLAATQDTQAAFVQHALGANAPAHCQAFTPGPTNTIRNRVVGAESIGAAMNVVCTFEKANIATA